jgi:predicted nucleic acid-binding protein
MIPRYYLDSTVILAAAGGESPDKASAQQVLQAMAQSRINLVVSSEAIVECLHACAWSQARAGGLALIEHLLVLAPHPVALTAAMLRDARHLLEQQPRLGIRAGLHAACARATGCTDILSYDEDFGLVAGLRRLTPAMLPSA